MLSEFVVIVTTLAAAGVAAVSQYLYKKNLVKFGFNVKEILGILKKRQILFAIGMYITSLLLYLYALHFSPIISFVYPIFASTFIFVTLISKYTLNERIGAVRILGLLFIMLGIALISLTYPVA